MTGCVKALKITLCFLVVQLVVGGVSQAGWVKDYVSPVTNIWSSSQDMNAAGETFVAMVTNVDSGKTLGEATHGEMSKIDQEGKILWSNRYYIDSPNGELPLLIERIRDTKDGGCIVTGKTRETLTNPFARPYWFAMKLDADGAVSWMTKLGHQLAVGQYTFPGGGIGDITLASDGGYVLAGTYRYDIGTSWAFVIKLGTNGELEWQRRIEKYDLNKRSLSAYKVVPGGDSGFFVVGWTDEGTYYGRLMIFKVDQNGNLLWQKKITDFLRVGAVGSNVLASPGDGGLVVAAHGGVVMKFDADGNNLWGKMLGGSSILFHSGSGGFYHLKSLNPLQLLELDANANILWERDFSQRTGSYPVLASVNGGFNIGYGDSTNVGSGFINFGLARIDSAGQLTECDTANLVTPAPATDFNPTVAVMQGLESAEQFFLVPTETVIKQEAVISVVDDPCNPANLAPLADAGDPQVVRCAGPNGAMVQLDGSWSTDPDGDALTFGWSGPFGQAEGVNPLVQLPFGDHQVTLAVTDSIGNTNQATVLISVIDDIAPQTSVSISGVAGNNGWYTSGLDLSLTSTDNCAGCQEIRYVLDGNSVAVAGNAAALQVNGDGRHYLSYGAVDQSGNQEGTIHLNLAIDQTAPSLSLPAGIIAEAVNLNGSSVDYSAGAADNLDPMPAFSCAPVSGSVFPLGVTTVACQGTDAAGNLTAGAFQVTVVDTTAPVVVPPPDQRIKFRGKATIIELGLATVTDAVGVASLVHDSPGDFPVGVTLVTWTATDLYGNVGTAVQTIEVVRGNSDGDDCDDSHDDNDNDDDDEEDDDEDEDEDDDDDGQRDREEDSGRK